MMRDRIISVTRRHVDFMSNREEETAMGWLDDSIEAVEQGMTAAIDDLTGDTD